MTIDEKRRELETAMNADPPQAVEFTYKSKRREGNPHTLGYLATDDQNDSKYAVRMYQTDGPSTSQSIIKPVEEDSEGENFRLFHVEDIDNITKLKDTFAPHPKFEYADKMFNWKIKGSYRTIEVKKVNEE